MSAKLGESLLKDNLITPQQLKEALDYQRINGGRLASTLVKLCMLSDEEVTAVLSRQYGSTAEAVSAIATSLNEFYRQNYREIYAQKRSSIDAAVAEVQRIFQTYFFPEMKTDWQAHPNNIGHLNFAGCFRCHDGEHVSSTGKVITNNCNVCHTVLYDSAAPPEKNAKTGAFVHPVDLGALADRKCESCHQPNKRFVHPINLGDISMFQCAECHPKQEPKSAAQ